MSLPMTRPFKHPRTGIYWIRKRVPADLYPLVGSKEVHRSLKTKDAAEAKSRVVEALADIERQWASLRSGRRALTERARKVLGWTPRHDLKSIIESAWAWHPAHPDGYKDAMS